MEEMEDQTAWAACRDWTPNPPSLGALGLVDLVSNHDGSGLISPWLQKEGPPKIDSKFVHRFTIQLFQMQS
jgi:hypothetical protein